MGNLRVQTGWEVDEIASKLANLYRELHVAATNEWQARDDAYISAIEMGYNHSQAERFSALEAREFITERRRLEAEIDAQRVLFDAACIARRSS